MPSLQGSSAEGCRKTPTLVCSGKPVRYRVWRSRLWTALGVTSWSGKSIGWGSSTLRCCSQASILPSTLDGRAHKKNLLWSKQLPVLSQTLPRIRKRSGRSLQDLVCTGRVSSFKWKTEGNRRESEASEELLCRLHRSERLLAAPEYGLLWGVVKQDASSCSNWPAELVSKAEAYHPLDGPQLSSLPDSWQQHSRK